MRGETSAGGVGAAVRSLTAHWQWSALIPWISLPLTLLVINAMALIDFEVAKGLIVGPLLSDAPALDWELYREAARRVVAEEPIYQSSIDICDSCVFRHSPVVAWIFVAVGEIGIEWFRVLHLVVLIFLPPVTALATLAVWPFWLDVAMGQVLTFVFVLAVLAVRGNRWASVGFIVMATLMPRPLMLPIAVWLLWKQPQVRVPVAIISIAHASFVLVGGYAIPWAESLLTASDAIVNRVNFGPSRLIEGWWVLFGVPLAAWLAWRGRLGLASLAASPYWLPYYLLFGLLDRPRARGDHAR